MILFDILVDIFEESERSFEDSLGDTPFSFTMLDYSFLTKQPNNLPYPSTGRGFSIPEKAGEQGLLNLAKSSSSSMNHILVGIFNFIYVYRPDNIRLPEEP